MRATLNIDETALAKARKLAKLRNVSLGTVVSDIILETLGDSPSTEVRNGVPIYSARKDGSAGVLEESDLETVNRLRDDIDGLSP